MNSFINVLLRFIVTNSVTAALGFSVNAADSFKEKFTYIIEGQAFGKNETDGVSTDSNGNSFLGGPFQGSVDFNGQTKKAKNGTDIYVTKLNKKGKTLWFISYDSGGNDFLYDLTTDSKGDVLLSGSIDGTPSPSGTVGTHPDGEAFFAKLSGKDGSVIWLKTFGIEKTGGNEITVDHNDNIVATLMGQAASYNFEGHRFKKTGHKDSFVIKMNTRGKIKWVFPIEGRGAKQMRAIGVSGKNDIILGQEYMGEVKFENITFQSQNKNNTAQGAIAVLSSNGRLKFAKAIHSKGFANARGSGGDKRGNLYFSGVVTGASKIGDKRIQASSKGSTYLAKIDRSGRLLWIRLLGNPSGSNGAELVVDNKNQIAVSNTHRGESLNLYNPQGKLMKRNLVPGEALSNQPSLLVFSSAGQHLHSYSPALTGSGLGGVLEAFANGQCYLLEKKVDYGIEFFKLGTYRLPDNVKAAITTKVCF